MRSCEKTTCQVFFFFPTFWLESIFGSTVARKKIEALTGFPETLYFQELDPSHHRSFFISSLFLNWFGILMADVGREASPAAFLLPGMCFPTFVPVASLSQEQEQVAGSTPPLTAWRDHLNEEQELASVSQSSCPTTRPPRSKHGCRSQDSRSGGPEAPTFAQGGLLVGGDD